MSLSTRPTGKVDLEYPDSDGQPMSDNTLQYLWITTIVGGLEALFRDRPDVFVAGDLLWYPVQGQPKVRTAPDALVAFGRPKGYRGSYKQWEESGIAPQVVFEVRSPGNRFGDLMRKYEFYDTYGVEEYYLFDPEPNVLEGWHRQEGGLQPIEQFDDWVSPRLGIRFDFSGRTMHILGPDGNPFATYLELAEQRDELVEQRDEERLRAERLAEQLRKLGIEPES